MRAAALHVSAWLYYFGERQAQTAIAQVEAALQIHRENGAEELAEQAVEAARELERCTGVRVCFEQSAARYRPARST